MKNIRKLVCVLLAALLLVLTAAPAFAISVNAPTKVYLDGNNSSGWGQISIYDLTANAKVTDIKSSNTKVLKPSSLEYSSWTNHDLEYDDEDSADYSAYVGFRGLKAGTATISFKVGGKTYSRKITFLNYANPVKSLVITGISKANLKSKFAKGSYYQQILKSNAKAGQLKVSAATGWKIKYISWSDESQNGDWRSMNVGNGLSTMNLVIPAMKKSGHYWMNVEFVNTKTKATKNINIQIGKDR